MKRFDLLSSGSVVVDHIHLSDRILGPESKGFVRESRTVLGGVALNHLSWAAVLGLKCGLLGPAADDAEAAFLRRGMDALGIDHSAWQGGAARSSVSHIYVDPQGERAIYQGMGASTELDLAKAKALAPKVAEGRMLACEVSQVALKAVLALVRSARKAGALSVLDLDIAPSQACGSQALGSPAELKALLQEADRVKAGLEAALELVPSALRKAAPAAVAAALHRALGKPKGAWVAITLGRQGCALADGRQAIQLPALPKVQAVDSTGAGDAFMGGLLVGQHHGLGLRDLGLLANACGAACVAQVGATADPAKARAQVLKLYRGRRFKPAAFVPGPQGPSSPSADFVRCAHKALAGVAIDDAAMKQALSLILAAQAQGRRLHVSGIGKCEYVARYVAASYSSTGTPCFFLHGTEAVHGSAGQLGQGDVLIAISNSGETGELKLCVSLAKRLGCQVIAVTSKPLSWLARSAAATLLAAPCCEGDPVGKAPRASVLAQMLVLMALGVELQQIKGFGAADFLRVHPGGSLGKGR